MTLYDLLSGLLTVVGYVILVYRIVHLLQGRRPQRARLQRLCTKWLVFAIFLRVEEYLLVVFDILPLGKVLLLLLKLFLFMPENSISHSIYKRIHKTLEHIKLEEYHSHGAVVVSFLSTLGVNLLLRGACKLAGLIDSSNIEAVERRILEIIKVLEYKRTAITMRTQAQPSDVNQQLNASEFNTSLLEEESPRERRRQVRSEVASQMNRLLVGGEGGSVRAKVEVMVAKPNREAGKKAKYSTVEAQFQSKGARLTLSSNSGEESWTLKEIRWITKNMLNIEAVFAEGGSRILRLKDPSDVVRWIEPICTALQVIEEESPSQYNSPLPSRQQLPA